MKQYFTRMFLVQTIQFIIIVVTFAVMGESESFYLKAENYLILLGSYVLYLGFGFFSILFRPLSIEVTQYSPLSSELKSTVILVNDSILKTVQDQRTVIVKLTIKRRKSIWWRFTGWLLEKYDVKVFLIPSPNDLIIRANNRFELKELRTFNEGFKINIKSLLLQLKKQNNELEVSKTYSYFIQANPDQYISNELSAVIEPVIEYTSNSKRRIILEWLIRKIIYFKSDTHKVYYVNKE